MAKAFTVEEQNMLFLFNLSSKKRTIQDMKRVLPHVDDEDIKIVLINVMNKLDTVTEDEFAVLTIIPAEYLNEDE